MNSRERRLLILLGIAVFAVLHVGALKLLFLPRLNAAQADAADFRDKIAQAETDLANEDESAAEVEWLEKHEPQPVTGQNAESQLVDLANREALRRGLDVTGRKVLTRVEDPALTYHRARVDFEVRGMERVLYQWLASMHSPPDFRAVTSMTIKPQDDDIHVTCNVTIEQWYVPQF